LPFHDYILSLYVNNLLLFDTDITKEVIINSLINKGGTMYDNYDYSTASTVDAGMAAGILGFFAAFWVILLIFAALIIVAMWRIFTKAGKPGWAAIVPIYNVIVLLQIINRPLWWVLSLFAGVIPVIGGLVAFFFSLVMAIDLAKSFGKNVGFGVLLALVPVVGYPMLAFGNAQYVGGAGNADPNPLSAFGGDNSATTPVNAAAPVAPQMSATPEPAPEASEEKTQ
jgi:hypothetical protein